MREDDRREAPLYLARYRDAQAAETKEAEQAERDRADDGGAEGGITADTPLYLRRFRDGGPAAEADPATENGTAPAAPATNGSSNTEQEVPLYQRTTLAMQQALTEDNRNKEISAPPEAYRKLRNDVYLIRHGETQGYSTDSGLTPQGVWQAHGYGHTLAKRIGQGETVVFRHAATKRATETAEQIHRGLLDGIEQYEKDITIVEPAVADEFRNFGFVAPDGLKDVTAAFREYYTELEGYERMAVRERPQWVVEMDRFWRTQMGGGDPIQHWLTIPLLHFEPPSMTVRRFWSGVLRLSDEFPGARLAIASHSGCIRAFAVSSLGYDPGEPYNIEHVRVKLYENQADSARGSTSASVGYRNRVQDVSVPDIAGLPQWQVLDDWSGFATKGET
jgi:broad specificity phosphatase PhoE